jgi:3-keto-5-aminohexanoate cleavage enzyme
MNPDILSENKVIITAAITGGIHGKPMNPNIPEQPEEQAQDALDCYNAGASVLHLHVRGADGLNTPDLNIYNKALKLIGEKSPIIRQIGNGIGAYMDKDGNVRIATLEERLGLLTILPQAEMHTINAGTFEFRTKYGSATFENPLWFNEKYVTGLNEQGIGIEVEVYDLSHVANVLELADKGILKTPIHFSFVMGIMGGIPADPKHIMTFLSELPEGSSWQVITIGRFQLRMTVMAMAMGGNIRTGMEDNIYYSRGVLAESNVQLVERMVRIARDIGREPATVEEAKVMLGLK